MRRFITLSVLACAVAGVGAVGLAALDACVPADNRPPPGRLTLTVSPSPAVQNGVLTADGWNVAFERVLVDIGRASLGNGCARYSDSSYDRLLDVTTKSNQKLSVLYGIGECDIRFRVQPPSTDAVLGEGVSEDQKTELRTPGGDSYIPLGGIAIDVKGSASREGVTKRFHLTFRPRVRYGNCKLDADGGQAVNLQTDVDEVFDIRIEAEAVLRDDVDAATASLRFEPFAIADKDGDGNVTLDELRRVPISEIRDSGAFEAGLYEFDDDAGVFRAGQAVPIESLGDYIYVLLLPSLPRFRGTGTCGAGINLGRGGGPG
jgi:hypothetical protein